MVDGKWWMVNGEWWIAVVAKRGGSGVIKGLC